jgi:uncharacterized protein
MNLIDTNIVLELLLQREKTAAVKKFFLTVSSSEIAMSDFSLHSIGLILLKVNKSDVLSKFVHDAFIHGSIRVVGLEPEELINLIKVADRFNLDFDDAYQYAVSEKYDLQIVSYDKDFDKTERGRKEPEAFVK